MSEETKLVWLPNKLADKINSVADPTSQESLDLINKYIDKTRKNYKDQLELLDEDVVMFRGLLVGVKKQYETALTEQLDSEYKLWEKIDSQRPKLKEKIQSLVDGLQPLSDKLSEIDNLLKSINTWEIKQLVEQVSFLSSALNGETGEMIKFICSQYKPKKEKN